MRKTPTTKNIFCKYNLLSINNIYFINTNILNQHKINDKVNKKLRYNLIKSMFSPFFTSHFYITIFYLYTTIKNLHIQILFINFAML